MCRLSLKQCLWFSASSSAKNRFWTTKSLQNTCRLSLRQCDRITAERSTHSRFCTWETVDYLSRTPFGTTITSPLTQIRVFNLCGPAYYLSKHFALFGFYLLAGFTDNQLLMHFHTGIASLACSICYLSLTRTGTSNCASWCSDALVDHSTHVVRRDSRLTLTAPIATFIFPILCLHEVQVFSIDAAHLKGDWNGVILMLSFKDADNNNIHVATAVCPKENADSYSYLLSKAMDFDGLGWFWTAHPTRASQMVTSDLTPPYMSAVSLSRIAAACTQLLVRCVLHCEQRVISLPPYL